jgi:hypothetical protein
MGDSPISPKDFGASFQTFMQQMSRDSAAEEPFFRRRLREHFGGDPAKFSIVGDKFADANRPNLHLALESYLSDLGRSHELLGISSERAEFMGIDLGHLISGTGAMTPGGGGGADEGPVAYTNVALDARPRSRLYATRPVLDPRWRHAACRPGRPHRAWLQRGDQGAGPRAAA